MYRHCSMNNTGNHAPKKRKYESPQGTVTPGIIGSMGPMTPSVLNIKPEPGLADCEDSETFGYDLSDNGMFLDGTYQVIKWHAYQPTKWVTLVDAEGKDL